MRHRQQYSGEERLQILKLVGDRKQLPLLAIEKDWWVTVTLKALSLTQYAALMQFKGGTSLSKGWKLIDRFSEDIDIALGRQERFAISAVSNSQLAKVKRIARHYIIRELPTELVEILHCLGMSDFTVEAEVSRLINGVVTEMKAYTDPSVVYVKYKSIVPEISEYLMPAIKLEISCLSMEKPVERKTFCSFISEVLPEVEDLSIDFPTVVPVRTFLEKIFLLHEEFQRENPRSHRMSRHLYDLERIMDTSFGVDALKNRCLYDEIIRHRRVFNNMKFVNYDTHQPQTVDFIPPPSLLEAWKKDYLSLTQNFLYHHAEALSFEELMGRMNILLSRIRKI